MWVGSDVFVAIGIKTSKAQSGSKTSEYPKNRRTTDPRYWWNSNNHRTWKTDPCFKAGREDQNAAMRALFEHATPLRLLIRVHVVVKAVPLQNQNEDDEKRDFNPDSDRLSWQTFVWTDAAGCRWESGAWVLEIDIDQQRLLAWSESTSPALLSPAARAAVEEAYPVTAHEILSALDFSGSVRELNKTWISQWLSAQAPETLQQFLLGVTDMPRLPYNHHRRRISVIAVPLTPTHSSATPDLPTADPDLRRLWLPNYSSLAELSYWLSQFLAQEQP